MAERSANFPAWAKPKAERRQMINGILQVNCNFVSASAPRRNKAGNARRPKC